jgi:hypothetical protein
MKARTLISILILVLAVLIIAGSCVPGNEASAKEIDIYKKLSGTWINKDYDGVPGSYPMAKYVIERDGTYDAYADTSDTSRTSFGEIISIDEKWIDSEGNFWYKATTENLVTNMQYYELGKIHSSGNVWELISLSYDYPNEIDPNHGKYRIYYRQE